MKIVLKSSLFLLTLMFGVSVISCKEGTKEKVKEAQEAVVEDAEDAAKSVGEAAENAGNAVKEAAEEAADAVSDEIKKVRVQFDPGATSKTVEGSITGYEGVDYTLNVKEGQLMNISMATEGGSPYFNIMEPGEEYVAIYNGSTSGNQFEGVAQRSGDYTIRVYMMRSAARRNETAKYRLEMIVGN